MEKKVYKSPIELKGDGDKGEFTAVFSRLGVIDKDGDVTLPGAFVDGQKVKIAYWGHRWQDLPVGRGVIHADDEKAWVDGKFFLDTEAGEETYKTVKNLGELQEWSYGFDILDSETGEKDGKTVRYLKALEVYEVSPVLLGAGVGTQTLAIKQQKELPGKDQDTEDEVADNGDKLSGGLPASDYKTIFEQLFTMGGYDVEQEN